MFDSLHPVPALQPRTLCLRCHQPAPGCYCQGIRAFDPGFEVVILIHPIEFKRRIATGRMAHLCLKSSRLIRGQDFSDNVEVNALIHDPKRHCVILYPGIDALNLTPLSQSQRAAALHPEKSLCLFVIDGTWATAKKTLRQSRNLQNLSRICFSPEKPSIFQVRKQPQAGFVSSIEAVHQVIELLGESYGFDVRNRGHDHLLEIFQGMIRHQLKYTERGEIRRAQRGQRSSNPESSCRGT